MNAAAVYAERDEWLRHQWKTGNSRVARHNTGRTDAKSLADAQKDREAAHSEHLNYLRDAWRG